MKIMIARTERGEYQNNNKSMHLSINFLKKKWAELQCLPGSSYFLGGRVASSATDLFPPSSPSSHASSSTLCLRKMIILIAKTRRE
jgi:hypothetical protein